MQNEYPPLLFPPPPRGRGRIKVGVGILPSTTKGYWATQNPLMVQGWIFNIQLVNS